ncbi:hypothetical protein [Nonomuraea rubra]|uniref:Uncharacterized protein n=1 Tax=Nonomuraea rubra TaxID=46180 RepID=A0A7X0P8H6_9ACTN|nr:hypothetical protein [Nonomuraea rubra]MBB6557270.1 hypothetical protein [Nonomuraea rubra]
MIAERQRLKPRQRRRLRDVRWSVQWWAALTSVVAGLMSVPALIISLNALELGQQQRADALAQRAEDKKREAQAKAEADAIAKIAFPSRIHIADEAYGTVPDAWSWNVRNANSRRAYVYVLHRPTKLPTELWEVIVEPCSEGQIVLQESASKLDDTGGSQELTIANASVIWTEGQTWTRPTRTSPPEPIPVFDDWIGLDTWPDDVAFTIHSLPLKVARRGITPCT